MAILLNKEQLLAVQAKEKIIFLVAGAGAGKTEVVKSRVEYILKNNLAHPKEILVLTYTVKASQEMTDRIMQNVKHEDIKQLTIGTFHHVFHKTFDDNKEFLGLKSISYIEDWESRIAIKAILQHLQINATDDKIQELLEFIERNKNFLRSPKDVKRDIDAVKASGKDPSMERIIAWKVYQEYTRNFFNRNRFDFADTLFYVSNLLRKNDFVRKNLQHKYKYIIVDEAQDLNLAQIDILKSLITDNNNAMLVGDFRQAIYGFRGSLPDFMLKHNHWFKGSKMYYLSHNYRSSKNIVDCANTLINASKDKLTKAANANMIPVNSENTEIAVHRFPTNKDETKFVIDRIKTLRASGVKFDDIAILCARNFVLDDITEEFVKNGIPYSKSNEASFWKSKEIKRITAFYTLSDLPESLTPFYDLATNLNMSSKAMHSFIKEANDNSYNCIEALEKYNGENSELFKMASYAIKLCATRPIVESFAYILKSFSIINAYENNTKGKTAIKNIRRLANFVKNNSNISNIDFVNYILAKLDTKNSVKSSNCVNVLTIHSSKGLEFKHVFLLALEDGILPDFRAETLDEIEEERRLFYVAITRAKDNLDITFTHRRSINGEPPKSNSVKSFLLADLGSNVKYIMHKTDMFK